MEMEGHGGGRDSWSASSYSGFSETKLPPQLSHLVAGLSSTRVQGYGKLVLLSYRLAVKYDISSMA